MNQQPGDWNEEIDGDEMLWVCPHCDAHLNADSVGENCPRCGIKAEDNYGIERED